MCDSFGAERGRIGSVEVSKDRLQILCDMDNDIFHQFHWYKLGLLMEVHWYEIKIDESRISLPE